MNIFMLSPNTKKNISSIIPINRSYYKLKEIISDYNMIDEKD